MEEDWELVSVKEVSLAFEKEEEWELVSVKELPFDFEIVEHEWGAFAMRMCVSSCLVVLTWIFYARLLQVILTACVLLIVCLWCVHETLMERFGCWLEKRHYECIVLNWYHSRLDQFKRKLYSL